MRNLISGIFLRVGSDETVAYPGFQERRCWAGDEGDDEEISSYTCSPIHCGEQMKKTYLLILMLLCTPFVTHASGGTCPSGANYINPANGGVLGPLVPLSTFGVTNCYYIAANGADSNAGTSEASPWLHAPGMPNCTSLCASTTPVPGEGFIVRGGDTWHYFTGSPQVGTTGNPSYYGWDFRWSGTPSNYIYIGVDPGWYSGSAWARPILTDDNPVVAGGIVSSCAYPMPNFADVQLYSVSYVAFDNFEFTGMCWNDVPGNTNVHTYLGHFGTNSDTVSFQVISNNYFHGWTHVAYNCNNGAGPVCGGADAIRGDTHPEEGTQIIFNVVDGADSDDMTMNAIDSDAYIAAYNVIRHVGGENIIDNCHSIHDNLFEYINNTDDGLAHSDMWFCNGEYNSNNYFYNNLVRYIATEKGKGAELLSCIFWFSPNAGFTDYVFNNVGHDVNCGGNCNNFHSTASDSFMEIFNNTWESMNNAPIWANGVTTDHVIITASNNHWITNAGTNCAAVFAHTSETNGGNGACNGDIFQTISAANAQGYTSANDYAPAAGSTATVGKGTNETGLAGQFGSAFLQSTTGSCTYSSANHSVSCPAVTVGNRLSTGAWDVGAYISGNANADQPPAPTNLKATVNN